MTEQESKQTLPIASSFSDISPTTKRMVQNFVLVWLDSNLNESTTEFHDSLNQLRSIVNDINTFKHHDEAIDFLTEISGMSAFLIVSDNSGAQILPLIHDIPQLDAIYIFAINHYGHVQSSQQWIKIKGVYTDISTLCKVLQLDIKQCEQDSTPISFLTTSNEVFNGTLNQLEPSFMYTQLFKEILLEMEHDPHSTEILAAYCRGFYRDNKDELAIIDRFEESYRLESVLWWYTRNCFVYKMLNRALRTLDGDTIIHMGFFIHDLHQRIQQLHSEQSKVSDGKPFIVYRGQGLSKTDFDKLMRMIGGLISFNNFLSTSTKQEVSLRFAKGARSKSQMIGVLFSITIHHSDPSMPFAFIREYSYYKAEEEILFSMHSVFRVGEIIQLGIHDRLYRVALTLTTDDDRDLQTLTQCIRKEIDSTSYCDRLGSLLMKLNQLNKAEELYTRQQQISDMYDKAFHYHQLGSIKSLQGNYEQATEYYEKYLEIKQKTLPTNHPDLATYYGNMAGVYHDMGEYSKALSFYEKTLDIFQKTLPANHPTLATYYGNMAGVYRDMGEYSKALSFYEKTLEIKQKTLPANHPTLATCYGNMAGVYRDMGEYSKALSFYEKTLEMKQKTLPANHPSLATCIGNMAGVYRDMGEYSKALSFYEKNLEIFQKTLPANHPSLATCIGNMAGVYRDMGEYSKALSFYEKELEMKQKTLPANHPSLATCYGNMAGVYGDMGEYSKALSFYEKNLEIFQKTLPANHPDLATCYGNMAGVYRDMGEYSKALSFYEKDLEMKQKTLPGNHTAFGILYNNIATLYYRTYNQSMALAYWERARIILQNALPGNHPHLKALQKNIETMQQML